MGKREKNIIQLYCHECGAEMRPFDSEALRPARRGRSDDRFQEIAAELKKIIVDGKWKPGMRIPTRRQLCTKYGASPITIQNIIDQFESDGFLRSDGRNGTHVVEVPPHLLNVALTFPENVDFNRLWKALSTVAKKKRKDGLNITQYTNIKFNGWTDSPEQVALIRDIKRRKLMGIFFTSPPFLVDKTPIFMEPGIPRCAFMDPHGDFPSISKISAAGQSFQKKALEFLKAKGRKKIAVIGHPLISELDWLEKAKGYGFTVMPEWILGMSLGDTLPGVNLARLLFCDNMEKRPDALVITDDNIVESVTRGIAEAGVKVPSELDIVAHCNFPCVPPTAVPVVRLGYDANEVLETAIRFLRAMRFEGSPPSIATVKAVFEDEI